MKKKSIAFFAIALCLMLAVLWLLQALLVPKYMDASKEGALIGEYYDNAGGNDVIFIGDCEVYENFSPITLWEEYGITSYIRGSAQQLIWQSYYLMEETLKYETPDVFVFNVLSMKYDTPKSTGAQSQREAYNRMTLDGMRWSKSKWDAITASMTEEEIEKESRWTYIFPILRYHDRWSQLTADDFKYWFTRDVVSDNGYLMQTGIKPMTTPHAEKPLVDYTLGENSWYYLDKMTQLCKENGVELVLVKAPTHSPVWWDEWDDQVAQYAQENGLKYYNFLEHEQAIGIDWSTDTYDTGLHLNVYGAEKLSSYFGKLLVDDCGIADRRSEPEVAALWAEKVKTYNERKAAMEAAN